MEDTQTEEEVSIFDQHGRKMEEKRKIPMTMKVELTYLSDSFSFLFLVIEFDPKNFEEDDFVCCTYFSQTSGSKPTARQVYCTSKRMIYEIIMGPDSVMKLLVPSNVKNRPIKIGVTKELTLDEIINRCYCWDKESIIPMRPMFVNCNVKDACFGNITIG
jgi:hypothetical protein